MVRDSGGSNSTLEQFQCIPIFRNCNIATTKQPQKKHDCNNFAPPAGPYLKGPKNLLQRGKCLSSAGFGSVWDIPLLLVWVSYTQLPKFRPGTSYSSIFCQSFFRQLNPKVSAQRTNSPLAKKMPQKFLKTLSHLGNAACSKRTPFNCGYHQFNENWLQDAARMNHFYSRLWYTQVFGILEIKSYFGIFIPIESMGLVNQPFM